MKLFAFLKEYYTALLLLLLFTYLVPKEEYRQYLQSFVGLIFVLILVKPLLGLFLMDEEVLIAEIFNGFNEKMEEITNEYVIFKGEGQ